MVARRRPGREARRKLAIMQQTGRGLGQRGLPFAGPLRNRSRRRGIYSPPNTPVGTEDVVREALACADRGGGCRKRGKPRPLAIRSVHHVQLEGVGASMDGWLGNEAQDDDHRANGSECGSGYRLALFFHDWAQTDPRAWL